jgi:hypothetical protein
MDLVGLLDNMAEEEPQLVDEDVVGVLGALVVSWNTELRVPLPPHVYRRIAHKNHKPRTHETE